MKGTIRNIILLAGLLLPAACDQPRMNFDRGIIPVQTVNFDQVNSLYDDYNSAGVWTDIRGSFILIFSSNRTTNGGEYDLVYFEGETYMDLVVGSLSIFAWESIASLGDSINSPSNEFGPCFNQGIFGEYYRPDFDYDSLAMFFTSDRDGSRDIYVQEFQQNEYEIAPIPRGTIDTLHGLNTSFDDGYLCLHPQEVTGSEVGYFNSNRDGNSDIYRAEGESGVLFHHSENFTISKVDVLNSPAEDKCPFIANDLLIFASNREGGYGGYDLWFSSYDGNEWSEPLNFGPDINTEHDEFRPIIMSTDANKYLNDLLIFSSNRPGGKGGYDLYYTGMKRRTDYR